MAEEYIHDADDYYDSQHSGLIDDKGKALSHLEQHEFMIGYRDDDHRKERSKDNLDALITACMISFTTSSTCCI